MLRTDDTRSAFDSQQSDMLNQRWSSTLNAKDKLTISVECTKQKYSLQAYTNACNLAVGCNGYGFIDDLTIWPSLYINAYE